MGMLCFLGVVVSLDCCPHTGVWLGLLLRTSSNQQPNNPAPLAQISAALQDGVAETGVSVAFTVLACDAGPVLEQRRVAPGPDETAPQLLERLFRLGARALLGRLEDVWAGRAADAAAPQDDAAAVHAPKVGAARRRVRCRELWRLAGCAPSNPSGLLAGC